MSNWTSLVNAEPGFLEEVFKYIKQIPDCDKNCNLVFEILTPCQYVKKLFMTEKETNF